MIKKSTYRYLIYFVVLFASLFLFMPFGGNDKCKWQQDFNTNFFYGVVVDKFIDSSQHSSLIVEVEDIKTGKLDTLDFFGDKSNVFVLVNKLDTIYKTTGSSEIFLKSSGKITKIGRVNFNCEN
jgi:hypothetical protein